MGWFSRFLGLDAVERAYAVDARSIPAQVFGLQGYDDPIAPVAAISRASAIQVPAVKRCRDLIAGGIGQLPLNVYDSERVQLVNDLLPQPEKNRGRVVTMTATVEDLLFEKVAWWRVEERAWDGYPRFVRRIDPWRVTVDPHKREVRIDGKVIPDKDLIRFDSPNDALLVSAARAIRTALKLDATAAQYADDPQAREYFTPAEDAEEVDDDEVRQHLSDWKQARKERSVGYIPAHLELHAGQMISPKDLQLADARQHAVLEIARAAGVDPEELGVSTTSRTYANQFDRRKAFLDFALAPYMRAIEDRLSMGDVTKRGNYVRFNLDAFLRSDTLSRWQSYEVGLRVGAITQPEIRDLEDKPQLTEDQMPKATTPQQVTASRFADEPKLELLAPAAIGFRVDRAKRTITGLAVPFGKIGETGGLKWSFSKDSIVVPDDVTRVKLLMDHSFGEAIGYAETIDVKDDGLWPVFKVARGEAGDRALSLAEDKVYDGLSVGLGYGGELVMLDDETATYKGAPLLEVSLTPLPAFSDARVTAVAASAARKDTKMDKCTKCGHEHDASAACVQTAPTFSAEQHAQLLALLKPADKPEGDKPTDGPQVVSASDSGAVTVTREEPVYRFDGIKGKREFSSDVFAMARGDQDAAKNVQAFLREQFSPREAAFDVDRADVPTLNPSRQRPDMYVDQKPLTTPLYDALNKGTIADATPFVFPKFGTAAGLVADHAEGVEPTPGSFTATNQTVTPGALSGKVEITREVFDAGGNPQVSRLIWDKMVRAWYDMLEAKTVAMLNAAAPTTITLTTAAVNTALANELEAAIAALQFVRGGNRFDFGAAHIDLYTKLAAAVDSTGRKVYPMINPANANGQARDKFGALVVAGVEFAPAPSLGATGTVSANSYLLDTADVHMWNTAPQRLDFQYRVAYVDMAIWGYWAGAISDLTGVRRIAYDPTV